MAREALLAESFESFAELADTLVDDFDVAELLTLLTDRCVEILEVDAAGIVLAGPDGRLRVMASSSEQMRLLELFELQASEGPCLDCYRTGVALCQHARNNNLRLADVARDMIDGRLDASTLRRS
jgi:GAF domain-containing protein